MNLTCHEPELSFLLSFSLWPKKKPHSTHIESVSAPPEIISFRIRSLVALFHQIQFLEDRFLVSLHAHMISD